MNEYELRYAKKGEERKHMSEKCKISVFSRRYELKFAKKGKENNRII